MNKIQRHHIWGSSLPNDLPDISTIDLIDSTTPNNKIYSYYDYYIKGELVLRYLHNYPLVKNVRQHNLYKLEEEDLIKRLILPSDNPNYLPKFYSEGRLINWVVLDPIINLNTNQLYTKLDLVDLKVSGWFYVGKDLDALPFDDKVWLLQNKENGFVSRLEVSEDLKVYKLPRSTQIDIYEDSTLVTNESINSTLNNIGNLDCGEWW